MINYTVTIAQQKVEFSLDGGYIKLNNKYIDADIIKISECEYSIIANGLSFHCFFDRDSENDVVVYNGNHYPISAFGLREKLLETLNSGKDTDHKELLIKAPMPGLIAKIIKSEQDQIHEGEGILVVEAMKMENEIKAPKSGVVKKIFVKEKQAVEKGDSLFIIE